MHLQDFGGEIARVLGIVVAMPAQDRPHPQRIEDGGDPAARQFRIMRENRRSVRPIRLRARLDVTLEVVGMKLDQPRAQEVAVQIDRARGHVRTRIDAGDMAIRDGHRAVHDLVRQNQPRIGKMQRCAVAVQVLGIHCVTGS